MNTKVIDCHLQNFEPSRLTEAADCLKQGGLVAFPTETVYGLGGDGLNADASKKIYEAKGRPSDNPLILHIADEAAMDVLAKNVSEDVRKLMDAFWPGPLTIVVEKSDIVPKETTGGLDTVAIRMPSHPVALELIRQSGVYIAAPSANRSGRPSPVKAQHVIEDLDGRIEYILDGGDVDIGIESTIVDMTGDVPMILRPGYITPEMIRDVLGKVEFDPAIMGQDETLRPKAPGMKYTHYAPQGELTIVEGERQNVVAYINDMVKEKRTEGFKVGVLATKESAALYDADVVLSMGSRAEPITVSAKLYSCLRDFDTEGTDYMYSESFAGDSLGNAIMNRLLKAAGHRTIQV